MENKEEIDKLRFEIQNIDADFINFIKIRFEVLLSIQALGGDESQKIEVLNDAINHLGEQKQLALSIYEKCLSWVEESEKRNPTTEERAMGIENGRKALTLVNSYISEALQTRMDISKKIGQYKKENNMLIHDPKQWKRVLSFVQEKSEQKCLDIECMKRIYEIIHKYSQQEQNYIATEVMQVLV